MFADNKYITPRRSGWVIGQHESLGGSEAFPSPVKRRPGMISGKVLQGLKGIWNTLAASYQATKEAGSPAYAPLASVTCVHCL